METLKPPRGAVRQRKRLGRGGGTGNGTTAGKGTKGQNARSGGGVRPGFEGGQMPLYRRVARRGFSNYPFKKEFVVVKLSVLDQKYQDGETVSLESLRERRIIGGRDRLVKVLGDGSISRKLTVTDVRVSRSAAAKIVAAGGSVEIVAGGGLPETVQEPVVEPAPKVAKKTRTAKSTSAKNADPAATPEAADAEKDGE